MNSGVMFWNQWVDAGNVISGTRMALIPHSCETKGQADYFNENESVINGTNFSGPYGLHGQWCWDYVYNGGSAGASWCREGGFTVITAYCRRVIVYDNAHHDGEEYDFSDATEYILGTWQSGEEVPDEYPFHVTDCQGNDVWNWHHYNFCRPGTGTKYLTLGNSKDFVIDPENLCSHLIPSTPKYVSHALSLSCVRFKLINGGMSTIIANADVKILAKSYFNPCHDGWTGM
jgi:hypothetical protein